MTTVGCARHAELVATKTHRACMAVLTVPLAVLQSLRALSSAPLVQAASIRTKTAKFAVNSAICTVLLVNSIRVAVRATQDGALRALQGMPKSRVARTSVRSVPRVNITPRTGSASAKIVNLVAIRF